MKIDFASGFLKIVVVRIARSQMRVSQARSEREKIL